MSRLTKKEKWVNPFTNDVYNYKINCDLGAIEKLGKIEDFEEELGCPLEALLSKSAMVVIDDVIYEVNIMAVSFTNGNIYFGSEWSFTTRKIKDYGKIWWLNESEVKQDE